MRAFPLPALLGAALLLAASAPLGALAAEACLDTPLAADEAAAVEESLDDGEGETADAVLEGPLAAEPLEGEGDTVEELLPPPLAGPAPFFDPLAPYTTGELARRARELEHTPAVQKHLAALLARGNLSWMGRSLELSTRYLPTILPVLDRYGLPPELAYLCVIESGFKHSVRSRARAVGIWQFIRGTSRLYGMRSDSWVDERYDFLRSTEAAARYLSALHGLFGDWELALAAYNCGEGRVQRALRDARKKGVRPVFENLKLPRETRHYVPYFYAGLLLSLEPARFGLAPAYEPPLAYDLAKVPGGVAVAQVAAVLGVVPQELRDLNPHLVKGRIPYAEGGYEVRIPTGLAEEKVSALETTLKEVRCLEHTVRRGDTLWGIARRYGVEMRIIQTVSGKKPRVLHPGDLLLIPLGEDLARGVASGGDKKSA